MTSPTASVALADFLKRLSESGLLAADEFLALPETDLPALKKRLIETGRLTAFQVDAIASDRIKDLRIGNYEVLKKLGAGGMGSVYKARHRKMKRIVAIKLLAPEIARESSFIQRFQREVETIAQLQHPNVVMAFDADEADAGHFLVMEFVDGSDLAGEVQHGGPLAVADAVDCIRQAAEGLAYAHRRGIVHRDVKPANLMRDIHGVVKVTDLGLARLNTGTETASLTQAGGILGTVDYMPPEQALDSTTIDGRADVYSLGCSLYFLLAGKPPFKAGSIMALLLAHRDSPIPSIRAIRPDVPESVDAILTRLMAKKASDRPSMEETCRILTILATEVHQLTARPSGTIAAETKPASSVMDMTVTLDASSGMAAALETTPPKSNLVVIMVEPSRTQVGIMRKMLQQIGIDAVHHATSADQAVQLAQTHDVDVVMTALHILNNTAVDIGRAVRAIRPQVGLVLISSETDLTEYAAALYSMQVVLLPKPFDTTTLTEALALATTSAGAR